jgi:hypothetical protein
MVGPRYMVRQIYPIAAPDDIITAIAPAYGFGSQTAFPLNEAAGQGVAGMVSVKR